MNRIDLEGRVAVVTGGAQGIGLAVARRLRESGATVWLWDRDAALVETAAGAIGAGCRVVDQTDAAAVMEAAEAVRRASGSIDILVANAGIAGSNAPLVEYDVAEWHRIIDINLNGAFHCCRAVLPAMLALL